MEDSPFSKSNSNTIVMYLEPMLDTYNKTYIDVITLSNLPKGPLANYVTMKSPPKLSEFQTSMIGRDNNCVYVLMKYRSKQSPITTCNTLCAEDIPSVFSFLLENGYIIDTKFTTMLQHSEVNLGGVATNRLSGKRKMICFFRYNL